MFCSSPFLTLSFPPLPTGNNDRKHRIKKGKIAQASGLNNNTSSSVSNSLNKHKPPAIVTTIVESPRSPYVTADHSVVLQVTELGVSPRAASSPGGSQRVQLLVDTGSGRIVMTGDVPVEELYGNDAESVELYVSQEGFVDIESTKV